MRSRSRGFRGLSSVALVVLLCVGAAGAFGETTTIPAQDIGTLGGLHTTSGDLNNAGLAVGSSKTATGALRAFAWDAASGIADIGGFRAAAVSDSGWIAGFRDYSSGGVYYRVPVVWSPGATTPTDIPGTTSWGRIADARLVNDLGMVAGVVEVADAGGTVHAEGFVWDATSGLRSLGDLGGDYTEPRAMNELGQIVGRSKTADGALHAFVWDADDGMQDLGAGEAYDVNDLGQVLLQNRQLWDPVNGFRSTDGCWGRDLSDGGLVVGHRNSKPCVYDDATGTAFELGTLGAYGGVAEAVNNRGQVVVSVTDGNGLRVGAYVWSPDDGYQVLGGLGTEPRLSLTVINDRGEILATIYNADYAVRAAFWATNPGPATPDEAIDAAIGEIEDLADAGVLDEGLAGASSAKLEAAEAALDRGNDQAACNLLQAFLNQMAAAVNSGRLTEAEAEDLVDLTQTAMDLIDCDA